MVVLLLGLWLLLGCDNEKDIMIEIEKTADERIKNMYDKKENKRNNDGRTIYKERKKRRLESQIHLPSSTSNSPTDSSTSSSITHISSHKRSPCELENINLHNVVQCRESKESVLHNISNSSCNEINRPVQPERLIHPHSNDESNCSNKEFKEMKFWEVNCDQSIEPELFELKSSSSGSANTLAGHREVNCDQTIEPELFDFKNSSSDSTNTLAGHQEVNCDQTIKPELLNVRTVRLVWPTFWLN